MKTLRAATKTRRSQINKREAEKESTGNPRALHGPSLGACVHEAQSARGHTGVQMTESQANGGGGWEGSGRSAGHSPPERRSRAPHSHAMPPPPPDSVGPGLGQLHGTAQAVRVSLQHVWVTNVICNSALSFLKASLGKHLRKDGPWGNKCVRGMPGLPFADGPGGKCYRERPPDHLCLR